MAFEGPVADRLAIRERIDAYGDAVTRYDADDWVANWDEDAVWALRGREIAGREAIGAAWREAVAAYRFVAFASFVGAITVTGDRASARVNTLEHLVPVSGNPRRQHGLYEDELVRRGDLWLFARRSFMPLHVEETTALS